MDTTHSSARGGQPRSGARFLTMAFVVLLSLVVTTTAAPGQVSAESVANARANDARVAGAVTCPRRKIILIGHRGVGPGTRRIGSKTYSEDTIPAFRRAMDLGADGFETDYWPSSDNHVVSHHDPTLHRMTNGTGRIKQRAWAYIGGLRNASGAGVATFGAVQNAMRGRGGYRQHEIKDGRVFSNALLRRMITMGRHALVDARRQVLFTSSQLRTLRRIERLDRGTPVGVIHRTTHGRPAITALPRWVDVILIDFPAADRAYVRRAHRAGFQVSVRTVNTVRRLHRAVAMGADRAVTDVPGLLGHAC